ncbi:TetR family transcriptional regulator [Solihabitans fulvus]|uniref:SbtR family transcriptional regulator n=1 Tax=Solihabitans fulvus TaxID=1892852 RepID=UPI001CB75EAB|nr:TetR family transcriptional regulator [Solihabitans fulvus]
MFADQFAAYVSAVDDALTDPDPWRGFCTVIEKVYAMQAADRGFSAAVCAALPDLVNVEHQRDHALRDFAELTRRAKESGRLRADFVQDDLMLLFTANCGIIAATAEQAPAASRRLIAYLLDALRSDQADPGNALPPPVPLGLHDALVPPQPSGVGDAAEQCCGAGDHRAVFGAEDA